MDEFTTNLIPNGYRHCCVIDSNNNYVDFVLVHLFLDKNGSEVTKIDGYSLQDGESLVDAVCPIKRYDASSTGFVMPRWNKTEWIEGATEDEIAAWEKENPAPATDPAPTTGERITALEEALAQTDETAIELYEAQAEQEEINAAQDEALIELYEMIGG